jgi:aspartate racemase
MRRIGLLGGMSWESSVAYERIINETVRARLGGVHSADLIVRSFDFAEIEALQAADDWEGAGTLLADAARHLESGGAELLVLCTNTMHRVVDAIEAAVSVPLLHIADATAAAVRAAGVDTVALLGTAYTMDGEFYRGRLADRHGLRVLVPGAEDRAEVHRVIFEELVRGIIDKESKQRYLDIIDRLVAAGARGVIAGCTEIELLVRPDDVSVPYFPTTLLHATAAADAALTT